MCPIDEIAAISFISFVTGTLLTLAVNAVLTSSNAPVSDGRA